MHPAAEPEVLEEDANTLLLDGMAGFGHYAAQREMDLAIKKEHKWGVCDVCIVGTVQIGRLDKYE